jgi:transposase
MRIMNASQWAVLKPALDAARDRGRGGRPLGEERRTVEAIAWPMRIGAG